MAKRIWITWENQRRNRTLSNALKAALFEFDVRSNKFVRYLISVAETLTVFIKEKPDLIFVSNPSILLAFIAVNFGKIFNVSVVVDAHNAGIFPFEGTNSWANKIAFYLMRNADITIVTNERLADYVFNKGGKSFVLPDPIPEFTKFDTLGSKKNLKGKYNIFYICTFAEDEPYLEVIKAARLLNNDTYVYISGKTNGKETEFKDILPNNVILTNYLLEKEYIEMLYSIDTILVLTTLKDCLLCGAYEAVAVEKPLIVSNTETLRRYFSKGTLYTDNTHRDIALKINESLKNREMLTEEIKALKKQLTVEWDKRKNAFEELLQKLYS